MDAARRQTNPYGLVVNKTGDTSVLQTPIKALLVDPSLFTAPYDAALTQGLLAAGVQPKWATRPTRRGDRQEIPAEYTDPFFYKRVDELSWLPGPLRAIAKGAAHALGLFRLIHRVWRDKPDVVHVQWVVLPLLDVLALWLIRQRTRLILTVHDTVPFNGERMSWLQNLGFDLPIHLSQGVIVHTRAGKERLVARGVAAEKIAVIPHGPLPLQAQPTQPRPPRDPRRCFVLFGEIKPYKGLDLVIEALGSLTPALRERCRVIVAGRPRMDMKPIVDRIEALDLHNVVELRLERQSEQAMADLFDEADVFVFPYRQIDASGVYFLVKSLRKWMIASRVGIFSEDLRPSLDGDMFDAEDTDALAMLLQDAIERCRSAVESGTQLTWVDIGLMTRALYEPYPDTALAIRQQPSVT